MKHLTTALTLAMTAIVVISSCNTVEENSAPEVSIIKPSASDNPHMSGMPISIQVVITDDEELHDTEISIIRVHDSAEVYRKYTHTHEAEFTTNEDTILTTSINSDFTITVTAEDHDGEQTSKSEIFRVIV